MNKSTRAAKKIQKKSDKMRGNVSPKVPEQVGDMNLYKIKNKEMYQPKTEKEGEDYHYYAVYKEKTTGEYRAIQLTHLYEPKKIKDIEKGYIMPVKIPELKYPSGVNNNYRTKGKNGIKLSGSTGKHICKIEEKQAKAIRNFAKNKYN